jgi:hypothetical protein
MVGDTGGQCIEGATVQVVSGPGAPGQILMQKTPCGYWDYDGGVVISNLTSGVAITLRASASGWTPAETIVVPTPGGQTALWIALSH